MKTSHSGWFWFAKYCESIKAVVLSGSCQSILESVKTSKAVRYGLSLALVMSVSYPSWAAERFLIIPILTGYRYWPQILILVLIKHWLRFFGSKNPADTQNEAIHVRSEGVKPTGDSWVALKVSWLPQVDRYKAEAQEAETGSRSQWLGFKKCWISSA